MNVVCPDCRLVQPSRRRCEHCAGERLVALDQLADVIAPEPRRFLGPRARFGRRLAPRRPLLFYGRVVPVGPTLVAPLSSTRVVAFETMIGAARDRTVVWRVQAEDFWIVQETGQRAFVGGSLSILPPSEPPPPARAPERWEACMALGLPLTAPELPGSVDELTIAPGAWIEVYGEPRRELHGGGAFRDEAELVLRGAPGHPVFLRERLDAAPRAVYRRGSPADEEAPP